MNCPDVQEKLPDLAVGLLDVRTARAVDAHLAECAACRQERSLQENVVRLVEQYGPVNPPAGLFNAVRNQIENGVVVRQRPAWWGFLNSVPARATAMGMAVAAVAFGLLMPTATPSFTPGNLMATQPEVRGVASSELARSIRQHAMSAGQGPLTDRAAWEAMAQLVESRRAGAGRESP